MDIAGYLEQVRRAYDTGDATKHSNRPALQALFQRGDVPLGWAEAKDIDKDVIKLKGYSKEQRRRYEAAYPNLIYTKGVDFEFIREGERISCREVAN